jgi:Na+/H+ antiporter NhaD/arsenite permease-like protein
VLAAPLVVGLIERHRLPRLPFLLGLASAANTGSVATLVGNPQNMLCANLGGLAYRNHLLIMGPVAVFGLAINHLLVHVLFRRELGRASLETSARPDSDAPVFSRRSVISLGVVLGSVVLYTLGTNLAWTATGACALLVVALRVDPDDVWKRIDWSVLLFFAGLFVIVAALVAGGAPARVFARYALADGSGAWGQLRLSAIFTLGSNVVSNVPFILVVRDQMATLPSSRIGWELLAMASTFAGNLTLIGSVANVIVAEKGRRLGGIGFFEHLRLGVPLTVLTVLVGTLWVILVA